MSMRRITRVLQYTVAAIAVTALTMRSAPAQSLRNSGTPFGVSDLAKLRWLEGTWRGTSTGESPVYERYHFVNDSTIEITYYSDSTLERPSGSGRVYLTVGRIYHTFGPGRWGASRIDKSGVYFVPQVNARNTFSWAYEGPNAWTATRRSGASGREMVAVYQMRRMR
jgi:hypothetical protein